MHGLMTNLARHHDLTAVMLVDEEFDIEECRRAMQAYCREVVLVPNPYGREGFAKRLLQLRSLVSTRSFERLRVTVPALQQALDRVLRAKRFDIVNLEFTFLGHCDLRQAPPGERLPALVVDSHNIDYELARQYARSGRGLVRRLYGRPTGASCVGRSWAHTATADGVYLCSAADERRLLEQVPGIRTAVIPNAADIDYYRPRPSDPRPDGRTIVFFGLLSYVPNVDGMIYFVQDIWPLIAEAHPEARLKDHRRPSAAVAEGAGRAPGRAARFRPGPAAAPRGRCSRRRAVATGGRHRAQNRRGNGHGQGYRLDLAWSRRDRGRPRARHSHRGPAGGLRETP